MKAKTLQQRKFLSDTKKLATIYLKNRISNGGTIPKEEDAVGELFTFTIAVRLNAKLTLN